MTRNTKTRMKPVGTFTTPMVPEETAKGLQALVDAHGETIKELRRQVTNLQDDITTGHTRVGQLIRERDVALKERDRERDHVISVQNSLEIANRRIAFLEGYLAATRGEPLPELKGF